MSTAVQYEMVEYVEELDAYQPGGFHPIHIGDLLHNRYRVVEKLGYGGGSTVWLALDKPESGPGLGYVAVKVNRSKDPGHFPGPEAKILSRLQAVHGSHRAKALFRPLLDQFSLDGPNGSHPCLVTVPARCSLSESKFESDPFKLPVARSLAAQLAVAVAYMHYQGYVHGDLRLSNVLLQLPKLPAGMSAADFRTKYGDPAPQPVVRLDKEPLPPGVPAQVYFSTWLGCSSDELLLDEARIFLADFGTALQPREETRLKSFTTLQYRCPECYFEPETPISTASDVWSLGCSVWSILARGDLVDGWCLGEDDVINDLVNMLGPLPTAWWARWEARSKYFHADGIPRQEHRTWSLDRSFKEGIQEPRRGVYGEVMADDERVAFLEMVRWMLKFPPGERPTAKEVLETRWMREWALPDYERGWEQGKAVFGGLNKCRRV